MVETRGARTYQQTNTQVETGQDREERNEDGEGYRGGQTAGYGEEAHEAEDEDT